VYLPHDWPRRFFQQYRQAQAAFGSVGVASVYGVMRAGNSWQRAGHVVDRDRLLKETPILPAVVETLDELLLVVPRDTALRFDPELGFHFYGADFCLACRQHGQCAVAIDALCFHNSLSVGLPAAFYESGRVLARKWAAHLPIATSCALVTPEWQTAPPFRNNPSEPQAF
jgi:hypothetical protein